MKAIMIMFDTLRRNELPPYGGESLHAPNFERLAKQSVRFDNFYASSLPCMPARRELHTGRHNFLHRSWGPLEPFDISAIELLTKNKIYTHLITDHHHYLEDGGATYHGRYSSWEVFRGQEGDRWKAILGDLDVPQQASEVLQGLSFRHNFINRMYQAEEKDQSIAKVFAAGTDFLDKNHTTEDWFLQIEAFDPHEPFFTPQKYKDFYPDSYQGGQYDYLTPHAKTEDDLTSEHVHHEYQALVSMCDHYLGKILDRMDAYDLWQDTLLIVNTDHGLLMGENEWWGKNIQPCYNEVAHLPFFIWDPRSGQKNRSCEALAQTIDIPVTLLDYFETQTPSAMHGKPLRLAYDDKQKLRDFAIYGVFGSHVNITDGNEVYMRACSNKNNNPLNNYTLMPTNMRGFFKQTELEQAELATIPYSLDYPVLRVPAISFFSSFFYGNLLYNLRTDPKQEHPLNDSLREEKWLKSLRLALELNEAPEEQYQRLGLNDFESIEKERKIYEQNFEIPGVTTQLLDRQLKRAIVFSLGISNQEQRQSLVAAITEDPNFNAETLYQFLHEHINNLGGRITGIWAMARNIYKLENLY